MDSIQAAQCGQQLRCVGPDTAATIVGIGRVFEDAVLQVRRQDVMRTNRVRIYQEERHLPDRCSP